MLFGGEIHNPLRPDEFTCFGDKHLTSINRFSFAGRRVFSHVIAEPLFKHQRDAFAHNAYGIDRIDRIDQCVSFSIQQVALRVANHEKY